jgi:hypothetical protein
MVALTRKQKNLQSEIKKIAATINTDFWDIERYDPKDRSLRLEIMKDKLIRSEIVSKYTVIDEYLTNIVCNYYFRRGPMAKRATYRRLWKTKRFRIFVHYLMDEIYLIKKMGLVDAIEPIPRKVKSAIYRVNDARNALAHSLFPQNLRRYMVEKKVTYNGTHLFTTNGLKKFLEDWVVIRDHLEIRLFGPTVAASPE